MIVIKFSKILIKCVEEEIDCQKGERRNSQQEPSKLGDTA